MVFEDNHISGNVFYEPVKWIGIIGPTGPVISGEQQQSFLSKTVESGLAPPLNENFAGVGISRLVTKSIGKIILFDHINWFSCVM